MAAVPRTATPNAASSSVDASSDALLRAVGRTSAPFSHTPTANATWTGTVAVPREQTARDAYMATADYAAANDKAQLTAANQRADRAGVSRDIVPSLVDYFKKTGKFPDLSQLPAQGGSGGSGGAGGVAPGGSSQSAISLTTIALVGGAVIVIALVLTKKGK